MIDEQTRQVEPGRGWECDQPEHAQSGLPKVVLSISGNDLSRTHFTFTNVGASPAFSVRVDTLRIDGQTMDFETIDDLRPGASRTCLSVVHPVIANDPHWTFDFWTASDEGFALPFIVRYNDTAGQTIVSLSILKSDGRRVFLAPDNPVQPPRELRG